MNPNRWTTESVLWSVVTVRVNPSFRPRQPAVRVVMNSSQLCVLVQGKGIKRGAPVLPLGSVKILPENLKPPPPLAPPPPSLSYVIVSRLRLRSARIYGLMTVFRLAPQVLWVLMRGPLTWGQLTFLKWGGSAEKHTFRPVQIHQVREITRSTDKHVL